MGNSQVTVKLTLLLVYFENSVNLFCSLESRPQNKYDVYQFLHISYVILNSKFYLVFILHFYFLLHFHITFFTSIKDNQDKCFCLIYAICFKVTYFGGKISKNVTINTCLQCNDFFHCAMMPLTLWEDT